MVNETKLVRRYLPYKLMLILLIVALTAVAAVSLSWGRFPVPMEGVWLSLLQQNPDDVQQNVVLNLRLPRVLAAVLVGAALSAAGTAYQGIFRNPLVSPDLLGVSAGACIGAAVAILAGFGIWGIQTAAFIGGLAAVGATLTLPKLVGRDSAIVLVLAGIVVSGFMSSVLGLVKYLADPETELAEIVYWQLGSLAKSDYGNLIMLASLILAAISVLFAMRWRINVLSLGDREARLARADITYERTVVVICATLLTASAVCLSGTIGWLGLVVPHLARMLGGDNNLRALPLASLIGSVFLLLTDMLSRNLYEQEIPLGIMTGFIGAPFFAWILVRQKVAD